MEPGELSLERKKRVMIRRTLLSILIALLLVAAPATALDSGRALAPAGWLAAVLDGLLDLFVVEKARTQNDPNGGANDDIEAPIAPWNPEAPEVSLGPGTA
jgi:hypothetical protein